MKTLKISAVVTAALTLAWWLRLPQRIWPMHPMVADLLMGIMLCVLLQFLWAENEITAKK